MSGRPNNTKGVKVHDLLALQEVEPNLALQAKVLHPSGSYAVTNSCLLAGTTGQGGPPVQ